MKRSENKNMLKQKVSFGISQFSFFTFLYMMLIFHFGWSSMSDGVSSLKHDRQWSKSIFWKDIPALLIKGHTRIIHCLNAIPTCIYIFFVRRNFLQWILMEWQMKFFIAVIFSYWDKYFFWENRRAWGKMPVLPIWKY